ncbi:MAG: fasciclin domain-containing protein [Methanoregula sp.]|nr:fasciclin domain-containing protein [Methanoregula sp.]
MKKLFVVLAILFVGILLAGCTSQPPAPVVTPTPTPVPTTAPPLKSIVDTAAADGRFTTLVSALQAANLTDTLSGTQVYTVFAPTDAAFKKLPNGTVATKDILLYHVVAGKVTAAEVVTLKTATTVQGSNLTISVINGTVKVNNANVIATDIMTNNGVIHVIDTVLIPPAPVPTATATPTPTPTPQPTKTITFTRDMTIMPSTSLSIPVGGKIIWKNDDPLKPHGIAAIDAQGAKYFGGLTGVQIPYGKPLEVTFDTVGTFEYKTTFQPETTGKITVTK